MGNNTNRSLDNKDSVAPAGSIDTQNLPAEQKDDFDEAKKEAGKAQAEAKERSEAIQSSIVDSATVELDTQSSSYVIQQEIKNVSNLNNYEKFMYYITLNNPNGFEKAIDTLLKEINDALGDARKKGGLSKAGKKTLDNTKDKLQKYKNTLNDKKNKYKEGNNKTVYQEDIENLKAMRQDVEKAKHDIAIGQRGELFDTAGYVYNSPENAQNSNKAQEHMLEFEQKLQQEVNNGAILNIFNGSIYNATNFYRRIAEGHYTSADYTRYTTYADTFNESFQRCGINKPTQQGVTAYSSIDQRTQTYPDYSNTDRSETFQQGGIGGCIDKLLSNCNNLTPGQRNTRKTLGVLAGFGGAIFGLYKFYKNKKMNFWGKAGITAVAILGSQILTGEGPLSLFNKLMTGGLSFDNLKHSFGNAISGIGGSGIESAETIAPAMYSMMVFNSSTTIGDINTLTQQFKSDNTTRKNFYNESLNKLESQYGGTQTVEYFRATFSEDFDEQKRNAWLASFGVVDISNPSNSRKLIYELANNTTMNEIAVQKFKSENGVKETDDKNKKQEFKQYINGLKTNNQAIDIAVLQSHINDWFKLDPEATFTEREEDQTKKDLLAGQVESLPLNQDKKEELKTAIKLFYDKRTIESKPNPPSDFSLEFSDGLLTIISHEGNKTQVNLEKRKIEGFQGDTFATLDELINAADITNKILLSQKHNIPIELPAFEYKESRGGICFNDAKFFSKDFDTRVLSTWRWKDARKLNPIYKYPKEYADYLSTRRMDENTIEINPLSYPIVESLSKTTGITFTNEQEVKDLEIRLQQIKEGKKFAIGDLSGKPFKISWQLKKLDNRLIFTAVDGTKEVFEEDISEKFPTIMRKENKEKFLAYMNNQENGMRGSEITKKLDS